MSRLRSKVEETAQMYFSKSSLYGLNFERIQESKLENVRSIHNIKGEEVLFLYDATLFGSAKDGIVFTESGIHWRERLGSPKELEYRELMESTANTSIQADKIYILGKAEPIKAKDTFYDLIAHLRAEFIRYFIVYDTYYRGALEDFERSLVELAEEKNFSQIVELLDHYEGLFLKKRDRSITISKISFQAHLIEKSFVKASKELEVLKNRDFTFYRQSAPLLERAVKEDQYNKIEGLRLKAVESEDFNNAYKLLKQQKSLNIRKESDLTQVESTMKKTQYEALNKDRLETMAKGDYDIAFSLLEDQRELKVKSNYEIDAIKEAMVSKGIIELIDRYQFEEAKSYISSLPNSELRKELGQSLKATIQRMHEEIRDAVRNKDYEYFKFYPDIWDYKDQYGMSALEYFALAGDLKGMFMVLEKKELLFMHFNIFGHNFIDLIGLATDQALEILGKIKNKVDLKQLDDRIKYLKRGQEGHFFSYFLSQNLLENMSREDRQQLEHNRLIALNEKLMSPSYFNHKAGEIENQENNTLDKIIKKIFGNELEDIENYPEKGEFERSKDYLERTLVFKRQYLERTEFINEYKRQNPIMVNDIAKLLEESQGLFGASLSVLKSLETEEGLFGLYDLYFPIEKPVIEIGSYDADEEVFFMMVNHSIKELHVPADIAEAFKDSFDQLDFECGRRIEEGLVVTTCTFEFGGQPLSFVI